MFDFLKNKKENHKEKESDNNTKMEKNDGLSGIAMKVEILGGGCDKCDQLEANVKKAAAENGNTIQVEHVRDFGIIASMGVMVTPALTINGKVVSSGKVLTVKEAAAFLNEGAKEFEKECKDESEKASEKENEEKKLKVAFICVHNSCRSQIAEALGKKMASDLWESYSAGTETKPQINQDAVKYMKELHGIDMEKEQHSKLLEDIPEVDIVVTMGCNVNCPYLPSRHREDWGLDDPSGKDREDFVFTIETIEKKILDLKDRIDRGLLEGK